MEAERVLVTGGAGYIGSHVCKALSETGFLPITYDDLSLGHREAVLWGPLEVGDVRDCGRLSEVMAKHRPNSVIHLAARAYVAESVIQAADYYSVNVGGSIALLQAMREAGIDRIVLSSSCSVYGPPVSLPVREEHPLHPISPYGRSKAMAEQILADAGPAHGVRSVILRYFNAAGADPSGVIGENHDPETHAIPAAIRTALGLEGRYTIHGTDFETRDGTALRDYVHVDDLAQAHVLSILRMRQGGDGGLFNLGSGHGSTVLEILAAVESQAGHRIPRAIAPRRVGDPPALVADAQRAQAELGWYPRLSDLTTIVRTAWHWHHDRMALADGVGQ